MRVLFEAVIMILESAESGVGAPLYAGRGRGRGLVVGGLVEAKDDIDG